MRKIVLLCTCILFSIWLTGQTTIQIGFSTGSNYQEPPFGILSGFERSAALYTHSEVLGGTSSDTILISSLKWQVQTANANSFPIKIFLKTTTAPSITSTNWITVFSDATLVFDGSASFSSTGWATFDIADFVYTGTNLMVLCQSNWGGTGNVEPTYFYYSTGGTNTNEWWRFNEGAPVSQTRNTFRPNIQITYYTLHGVMPPNRFMATAENSYEIYLNWLKNSVDDSVMIAYNTANTFGTPSGTYAEGSTITGGGTVVYIGSDTSFTHAGRNANTIYYYKAWSYRPPALTYSTGTTFSATTFCDSTCMYPYLTDFESATFPPSCWSLAHVPWVRSTAASGYGSGTASAKADFFHLTNGNVVDLISPPLDLSSMPNPGIKFDEAYATNTNQVDSLQLWVSSDYGETFTWWTSWAGGVGGPLNTGGVWTATEFVPAANKWATKTYVLPVGTNKIMFRGLSAHGNDLYLDNINFYNILCDTVTIPYNETFDNYTTPSTGCVKVIDSNSDTYKWITSGTYAQSAPNSIYIPHNTAGTMNDWFFTPALSLTGGTTYLVDFYYRSGGAPSAEKLEVKFGTNSTAGSMGSTQIWSNTNIQNTTYLEGSGSFTPATTGIYYVGFRGYSNTNQSWISVDNIHIDIPSVTWSGNDFTDDWNDPLNWTPNIVPTQYQTVTIPIVNTNDHYYPGIYNTGMVCKKLTLNSGVTLNVYGGAEVTIKGNLTIQSGATLTNDGVIILKGNLINQN